MHAFLAQDHNITVSTERVCMIVQDNAGGTKPESTKPGSMTMTSSIAMDMSAKTVASMRRTPIPSSRASSRATCFTRRAAAGRACGKFIERGSSQITGLKRGQYAGMYLHALCAKAWYESNPLDASCKMPELEYHQPTEELANWLDKFVDGTDKLYHLSATAGAGKSNNIMYTCDKLRKRDKTFIVLVFSISAKEVLMKRGLMASEVINFLVPLCCSQTLAQGFHRRARHHALRRQLEVGHGCGADSGQAEDQAVLLFLKLTKAEHCGALTAACPSCPAL